LTWAVTTAMRSRLARGGRVTNPGMQGARAEHETMLHEQQVVPGAGWQGVARWQVGCCLT